MTEISPAKHLVGFSSLQCLELNLVLLCCDRHWMTVFPFNRKGGNGRVQHVDTNQILVWVIEAKQEVFPWTCSDFVSLRCYVLVENTFLLFSLPSLSFRKCHKFVTKKEMVVYFQSSWSSLLGSSYKMPSSLTVKWSNSYRWNETDLCSDNSVTCTCLLIRCSCKTLLNATRLERMHHLLVYLSVAPAQS